MKPACPKCLTDELVEGDGGHGRWLCGRQSCMVVFTGNPSERAHFADRARKQEAHMAALAREALAQVEDVEDVA